MRIPRYVPTLRNASSIYLALVSFGIFAIWIPNLFYSAVTFKVVASGQVVTVIVALAILVPFTTGVFDLSAGYMVGFSLVILSWLRLHGNMNVWLACLIAILACGIVGLLSGLVTVRYNVNSFIATLGMGQIIWALTLYLSSDQQIIGVIPATLQSAGQGNWFGVPKVVYYLVVLALVLWYVLEWTPLGRNMSACGSNMEAARLVGIPTKRLIVFSLSVSGLIAGFGGVVLGAQVAVFSNTFGAPLLFPAFAALFFGSTQFKRRPNVWGTVVASYVLAYGVQGLQLASSGGSYWITPLFDGVALLIAVGFASRTPYVRSLLRRRRVLATEAPAIAPDPGKLAGAADFEEPETTARR